MSEIILALCWIITLVFLYQREQQTATERQKLYDRIQSSNLPEYKALVEPTQPKEKEKKERPDFV